MNKYSRTLQCCYAKLSRAVLLLALWAKMSSKKALKEDVSHFIRTGQYINKFIKHKIRSFNSFLYIRLQC